MTDLTLSDEQPHQFDKHGPQTAEEMGRHPTLRERAEYDLLTFNPLSNYIEVWHTRDNKPETVVRKWITANKDRLQTYDIGKRELTANISGTYERAWANIRDDYEWLTKERTERTDSEQGEQTCPLCGEDGLQNLPNHMRGCDGESSS